MLPIMIMMAIENEEDYTFVEKLYDHYEKYMYAVAFSILHNHQDSEDCVHEAVISIVECLSSFKHIDEERKLRRLVAIAARNKAIDIYRHNKRQLEVETSMAMDNDESMMEHGIVDEESDVVRMVITDETHQLISALVRNLDDIYRDVIVLKFEQEMINKEIAKFLGISNTLVRVRFMRAKKLLKEMGGDALYEAAKA